MKIEMDEKEICEACREWLANRGIVTDQGTEILESRNLDVSYTGMTKEEQEKDK